MPRLERTHIRRCDYLAKTRSSGPSLHEAGFVPALFIDARQPHGQIASMIQDTVENLEKFALDAAREIAGPDAVEQVEVVVGVDYFERPSYDFSFLVDPDRIQMRIGLVLIRLGQRIRDELNARGDEHHPIVRLLGRNDWPRRGSARTVV
jgi:hypothetical protein